MSARYCERIHIDHRSHPQSDGGTTKTPDNVVTISLAARTISRSSGVRVEEELVNRLVPRKRTAQMLFERRADQLCIH